jgi:DNA-binding response OmpR family regulator
VLIVDDDPAFQRLLGKLLEHAGHGVAVAGSGAEADRLLAAGPVALILLDLFLPDEDGRRLLVRWRGDLGTRRVPIFVLSAALGNDVKTECFELGADAYFEKPIDPRMIVAAVGSHLGRREADPESATGAAPGAGASPSQPPEARLASGNRVLLVEDDRSVAAIIRHRLTRSGYELHHWSNGAEALDSLDSARPDLAILDIKLPGMDGLELLARLRDRPETRAIPVIMLTASAAEEDMVRAFALGADDYLIKPFSPTELMARVSRLERRGRA